MPTSYIEIAKTVTLGSSKIAFARAEAGIRSDYTAIEAHPSMRQLRKKLGDDRRDFSTEEWDMFDRAAYFIQAQKIVAAAAGAVTVTDGRGKPHTIYRNVSDMHNLNSVFGRIAALTTEPGRIALKALAQARANSPVVSQNNAL